ncbi:MAG: type II toxin-antitoxin system RelE/ParE family toxin [bacterium]|nr:type II toxin-antitoxin system RelE/ParE family toxin [bacterium]
MTAPYRVEFTRWAESDLDQIVTYIAENDNVSDAVRVYYALKKKVSALDELAVRGRVVPELKRINILKFKEIIHSPYRIIYKIEDTVVFIVAIFDGRRDIAGVIYRRVTQI